jgi:hypothetical protein
MSRDMNVLKRGARWYDTQLRRHPLLVKCVTSACIVALSDVGAQWAVRARHRETTLRAGEASGRVSVVAVDTSTAPTDDDTDGAYDPLRTAIVGVGYGGLCFAPILHAVTTGWARAVPSTSPLALLFKVSVDMITSFPVNLGANLSIQAYARGGKGGAADAVRHNFVPTILDGWKFWPLASAVMLRCSALAVPCSLPQLLQPWMELLCQLEV